MRISALKRPVNGLSVTPPYYDERRVALIHHLTNAPGLIASTGDRVVMAQTVESLLAALVTPEEKAAPPVVASTSTPPPGVRANESPPSGANAEALNHYRRAFEALNKGDWRTFGAEMDAMQKALQSAPAKSPP